jgi:hypothetical protein
VACAAPSTKGAVLSQQLGEVCITFCAACGERLRWERNDGEVMECWIGRCECGWLCILHLRTKFDEATS